MVIKFHIILMIFSIHLARQIIFIILWGKLLYFVCVVRKQQSHNNRQNKIISKAGQNHEQSENKNNTFSPWDLKEFELTNIFLQYLLTVKYWGC